MSACRALEAPQRVAYLGPAGTFSEQAAIAVFRRPASSACPAPASTKCSTPPPRAAPSSAWCRSKTPPKAWSRARSTCSCNSPLHMVGETSLLVRHNLLRLSNSLDGIEVVLRPPAGAGPMPGLAHHAPAPGRAPRGLQQRRRRAPGRHQPGLGRHRQRTRRRRVRPAHRRRTRSRTTPSTAPALPWSACRRPWPRRQASGKDCVSLIVSVPNRPGAVHDLLVPLKQHGVSMTRFESRPARSGQWEYYFYIDIQGHPSQPHVAAALKELQRPVRVLQGAGHLPGRRMMPVTAEGFGCLNNWA